MVIVNVAVIMDNREIWIINKINKRWVSPAACGQTIIFFIMVIMVSYSE